jgi:hypothetical protein
MPVHRAVGGDLFARLRRDVAYRRWAAIADRDCISAGRRRHSSLPISPRLPRTRCARRVHPSATEPRLRPVGRRRRRGDRTSAASERCKTLVMASAIARVLAAISAFPAGRSAARVTMAAAASAATAVGRSCIRPPFRVPKLRPPAKAMIVWPMRDWLRLNRPAAHVVDSLADARQDKQPHAALIDAKDDPLFVPR